MSAFPNRVHKDLRTPTSTTRLLVGRSLVVISVAAIAFATLTPDAGNTRPFDPLCVVCGDLGGVDVVLNFLLFLPLGFGLALAGARPVTAIAGMFAASLTIELLQFVVVPGRDPTVGDVLMNSIGGAAGFTIGLGLDSLLQPSQSVGVRLLVAWSAMLLVLHCVAAYSLVPALTRSPYYGQIDRELGGMQSAFPGEVLNPALDSVPIPDSQLQNEVARELLLQPRGAVIQATVIPAGCPTGAGGIVRIADLSAKEILVVAEKDADMFFGIRTGAEVMRLRPMRYRLRHVFGPGATCALLGDTILLQARYTRASVLMRSTARRRIAAETMAPSVFGGWRLFLPTQTYIDSGLKGATITAIWLFVLMFPLGYWGVFSARRFGRGSGRASAATAMFLLAVMTIALVAIPGVFGLPHARTWEWVAAMSGAVAGVAAACRSFTTKWGRSATRNPGQVSNPN